MALAKASNGNSNAGGNGNGKGNAGGNGNSKSNAGGNGNGKGNAGGNGKGNANASISGKSKSGKAGKVSVGPKMGQAGAALKSLRKNARLSSFAPVSFLAPPSTAWSPANPSMPRQPHSETLLVASGVTDWQLRQLRRRGFQVSFAAPAAHRLVRLRIPTGMTLTGARASVQAVAKAATVDLDHFYYPDGQAAKTDPCADDECATPGLVGLTTPPPLACGPLPTIGMVDTAIDLTNETLRGTGIEAISQTKLPEMRSGVEHGTAIAALLVGTRAGQSGLLAGTRLIAVDAFFRDGGSDDKTDAAALASAIETLVARDVRIINLSLSGPPNAVLEEAIKLAQAKGVLFVAAAGNNGPGGDAAYPGAYPSVLAVTAIDRNLNVYRRANRGSYLALAAPGVDVRTPAGDQLRSGTSYAVPFVTAAAALVRAQRPGTSAAAVTTKLESLARDLGAPGYDDTYGWGLLQAATLCQDSAPGLSTDDAVNAVIGPMQEHAFESSRTAD